MIMKLFFRIKKVSSSDLEGRQRDKFDIDKSNQYQTNKDIFNEIEEVVILSESQCSSDLSYKQGFSTSLLDINTLFKVSGDRNWLFRALSKVLYGTEEYHVQIRTNIWDYIITHKARFSEFMEEGIQINDYISDMLISREWGGHTEIVAFSEIYNTSVHVFDLLASEEPVRKIVTPNSSNEIAILFSGDHYDCLLKSSDEEQKNIVEVEREKWNDQAKANVRSLKRDCSFQNDYATKYSNNFVQSIIKYLSNGTFPQSIEDIRSEKNKIISNSNSAKADKAKIKTNFSNAKRQFRFLISTIGRYKIIKYTFLGNEYTTLARKWGVFQKQKKDDDNREVRQRRSKSVDPNDERELKEYLIIPFKWQVPVIIF